MFSAQVAHRESSEARIAPPFDYVTNQSIVFTHGEPVNDTSVSLDLYTVFSRAWHIKYTLLESECPTGYKSSFNSEYSGDVCQCSLINGSYHNHLSCASDQSHAIVIDDGHWIGQPTSDGTGPLYMGLCPLHYCMESENKNGYILPVISPPSELNFDHAICSHANRMGVLCGQCMENFSISANTFDYRCVNCSNADLFGLNLALYLTESYLPVIVLFIVIIVFNIRLTTGPAVSFIFFCQVVGFENGIAENMLIFAAEVKIPSFLDYLYKVPFNVLNLRILFLQLLDYQICFRNLNALDITQLNALVAVTPLLMIVAVILALKVKDKVCTPAMTFRSVAFCRANCSCLLKYGRNLKLSLLHAFAAFILLSYNTFCISASALLDQLGLYNESGAYYHRYVSYRAGHIFTDSVHYQVHYALPAYFMILVFIIPPLVLLLGFPVQLFERCIVSRSAIIRKYYPADKMAIFLDTFQGCYCDKMRFFAGLYLFCRVAILLTSSQSVNLYDNYLIQAVIFLVMLLLIAICQPYRQKYLNIVDSLIFADLVLIQLIRVYLIHNGQNSTFWVYCVCYILIFLPVFYMLGYLFYLLIGHQRLKLATNRCLNCCGQQQGQDNARSVLLESSVNDNEVQLLLRRAEQRNNYHPAMENYERSF